MFLIDSLVKLVETIYEHIEEEYYDEGKAMQDLLKIRLTYELGELDTEEYMARERKVMERIVDIRDYRKRLAAEEEYDE
jgi:hypothetical protein